GISSTKNAPPPAPLINMLTSTLSLIAAGLLASGATVGPQTGVSQATGQSSTDTYRDFIRENSLRCGTPPLDQALADILLSPSDCAYGSTNPTSEYEASYTFEIPVVVHVIQNSGGTGFLSAAQVQSQIDILNEDFGAIPSSNGSNGFNTMISFKLADTDPSGNATTGITYSTNTTWFNDGGSYWTTLAWDTNNYLNIYTNSASGYLGYVPDLPQGGIVGSSSDRVVCLWSAFGRNSAGGAPYNQGRTATHELGHYLGLWHTFDGGCAAVSNCYTNGDRICDTNAESGPIFGCPGNPTSCSTPDPKTNYMDYSDDLCMEEFTSEQSRRMRCTLEFWRPSLADVGGQDPVADFSATPLTGDAPLAVNFSDLSAGTAVSGWSWSFGDGNSSTSQNPSHVYSVPGTYDVSLTVTGSAGNDSEVKSDLIIVTVDSNASATKRLGSNTNPDIFDSVTLPVLGTNWVSTVNGGSVGASGLTFVFGFAGPVQLPTAFGELLVDPTSSNLLLNTSFITGGTATHTEPVPADNALLGLAVFTQVFMNQSSQLTNAIDLVLGN
ncbi:MAG: hypothetical protein ACI8QS_002146, partial [Planctomycetota bacterium]